MKTKEEIYKQIDKAMEAINEGGKFNGMSYEDGVKYALEWVCGDSDEEPMPEEN